MKKGLKLLIAFFTPFLLMAQEEGIRFSGGNWQEMLQKSREEKKLIFIDVYTTWSHVIPSSAIAFNQACLALSISPDSCAIPKISKPLFLYFEYSSFR